MKPNRQMEAKHPSKASRDTDNDHQKAVQGKNQRGPGEKVGRSAGGNEGSRGQNVDARKVHKGKRESEDLGDERGPHGGSGGGQGNRQNRAVNRS